MQPAHSVRRTMPTDRANWKQVLLRVRRRFPLSSVLAPCFSAPTRKGTTCTRQRTAARGALMPILLAVDDDPMILAAFRQIFRQPEVTLLTASSAHEGLEKVAQQHPDVVILDINLPDLSGLEIFQRIQKVDARIPVIFVTGQGTTETAIEAMKLGAYEYLLKDRLAQPQEVAHLRELVHRAFEISRLMHVPALMAEEGTAPDSADVLVGRGPAMQAVYKAIG